MKQTCLKFLESGRDGTGAVGDGVSLARHVLALDVGDVHEKLLARVLHEGGRGKERGRENKRQFAYERDDDGH